MIKRILTKVLDDVFVLFDQNDQEHGHQLGLVHNKQTMIDNFGHEKLLIWDVFVWANINDGECDAIGIFLSDRSVKFGRKIFNEFLWISKNPMVGYKILKKAINFARENEYEFISMHTVERQPNTPRYERFYKKLGFVKDSTQFISKL